MSCYHPLSAYRGPVQSSGKRSIVFRPSESTAGSFALKLPCGQCIGCRLDYSLDWASRLMCEKQMHAESCFVTLTYSDDKLRVGLVLRDFQLFMKRLRRFFSGRRIRFFHCGEYGEKFGRPHYHALLFGVDFSDRVLFKRGASGFEVYTSDVLSGLWSNGFATVGDVTLESCAYVARYCLKKLNGKAAEYVDPGSGLRRYEKVDSRTGELVDLPREYVTMSRRPGIASEWYAKYRADVYPAGVCEVRPGIKRSPPRYFDGKYELENPLDMGRIKLHRMRMASGVEVVRNDVLKKDQVLSVNRDDRLVVMEEVKERQLSVCRRNLESGQ